MSTADNNTSQSSSSLNNNNNNNNRDDENRDVKQQSDHYLKQLNRASHKISKPIRRPPPPPLEHHHHQQQQQQDPQQQQHQPPVYNINKSDFRDVVQKLTGSPLSSPPSSSSSSSLPHKSTPLKGLNPPTLASTESALPHCPISPPTPPPDLQTQLELGVLLLPHFRPSHHSQVFTLLQSPQSLLT
ncbi:hypothetical protein Scep_000943 [Stephania cephalantha]|uniref:VQ domain-containing protein n=1 Tax=Stephania cephalantha TaxID=152367 RepID=A0AAP0L8J3_9MAGN